MNQKPLSAAYEHMTNRQLAAAAYAHLGDELESLRIQSVVSRKNYTMLDAQFVNALERIHTAGHLWGCDYWRLQYMSAVNVLRMAYLHIKGELRNEGWYAKSIISSGQVVAAHYEALREVCERHGLDYKMVLKSNCITEDVDVTVGVDQKHKAAVIGALEVLLTGGE